MFDSWALVGNYSRVLGRRDCEVPRTLNSKVKEKV